MTAPLPPPCPPLIVFLDATTVRIKMYAPQYGAFKFLLQLRTMTACPGNPLRGIEMGNTGGPGPGPQSGQTPGVLIAGWHRGNTALLGGGVAANSDISLGGWVSVYYGMETMYICTTMHTDADYEARYFAVNCQGAVSEASEKQSFVTLHRSDTSEVLTHRNAERSFTVECTGDIVVGDTILMTERLFSKPNSGDSDGNFPLGMGNSGVRMSGGLGGTRGTLGGGGSKSTLRLNMSTTSQSVQSIGGHSTHPAGVFIGERTIAAYVIKDNYRSSRDEIESLGTSPKDIRKFGKYRRLWLEIVWTKSSTEACKQYELKPGSVIERQQAHLEQFEVFRCPWRMDNLRKPLFQEWEANKDCFLQTDC